MKYLTVLASLALVALSCTPCRYASRHPECFRPDTTITYENTTTLDSIIYLDASESTLEAYFECDSLNRVLMYRLEQSHTGPAPAPVVIYKDNILRVKYLTDSIAVLNRMVTQATGKTVYIVNPVNEQLAKKAAAMHLWRKIGVGGIVLAVLAIVFVVIKIFL